MKNSAKHLFICSAVLFLLFIIFTILVASIDVQPIGPEGSLVGFATINGFVFQHLSIHLSWYTITDGIGIIAILFAFGFSAAGLYQLIKRKSLKKVDPQLLILGMLYLLMIAVYLFFERVIINYRPVILGKTLEASYPSSHTMLVVCIMITSAMQLHALCPNRRALCLGMDIFSVSISAITVIGRLICGVHWFTDIIGGLIVSAALIALYHAAATYIKRSVMSADTMKTAGRNSHKNRRQSRC